MTRTFFSEKRAEAFAEDLRNQGINAEIWSYKDGFGQTIYSVRW